MPPSVPAQVEVGETKITSNSQILLYRQKNCVYCVYILLHVMILCIYLILCKKNMHFDINHHFLFTKLEILMGLSIERRTSDWVHECGDNLERKKPSKKRRRSCKGEGGTGTVPCLKQRSPAMGHTADQHGPTHLSECGTRLRGATPRHPGTGAGSIRAGAPLTNAAAPSRRRPRDPAAASPRN